jgi:hypothetical protein
MDRIRERVPGLGCNFDRSCGRGRVRGNEIIPDKVKSGLGCNIGFTWARPGSGQQDYHRQGGSRVRESCWVVWLVGRR